VIIRRLSGRRQPAIWRPAHRAVRKSQAFLKRKSRQPKSLCRRAALIQLPSMIGRVAMNDDPLSALASAWTVSMLASSLLFIALALAPIWNTSTYFGALNEALTMDHF
jgi:hypothetical protein